MMDTSIKAVIQLKQVDPVVDEKFIWDFRTYEKFHHLKTFLEKTFECKLIAAYVTTTQPRKFTKTELGWDGASMALFFESGRIVNMWNSEWAGIDIQPINAPKKVKDDDQHRKETYNT